MSDGLDIRAIKADIARAQAFLTDLRDIVDEIEDGLVYMEARILARDIEQTSARLLKKMRMAP